jgi:hypothetical protein
MIQFIAKDALKASYELETLVKLFEGYRMQIPSEPVAAGHCKSISRMLTTADVVIKALNLRESHSKIERIKTNLELWPHGHNMSQAYTLLHELHWSFVTELQAVSFAFIPADKLKYFEKDADEALFGEQVYSVFPDAWNDIRDAGNSLASGLHDGAVFYLMRVVEIGLRELARKLRVKTPNKPLDYAGWAEVVKVIDDKLSDKIPKSRSAKKIEALKFKHALLADFKAFEVLRNEIMHGRSHHNEQEAIGLFNRVRDFMQRLANNL